MDTRRLQLPQGPIWHKYLLEKNLILANNITGTFQAVSFTSMRVLVDQGGCKYKVGTKKK